ncbi:unnamed protein product [Urochloa humidicola]
MDLVAGAVGNLAPKLLQLLQDEYKLHKGLRDEVKSLAQELESTHVALCKVAQVPPDQLDPQVKLWARHVRESSYDMEDILDTFLVRVDGRRRNPGAADDDNTKFKLILKKIGDLFSPSKIKARQDIAMAIKDIKKQLQEVAKRRDRCKVEIVATPASSSTIDPRLEAMYKEVTELVGIERAMDELISMLSLNRYDKLKIVSILGIGGLGKTTLAKGVYDKLKYGFDCGAFVPVGRNPDLKKVFRDILIDLDRHEYTVMVDVSILDGRQLIDELRDFLKSKRYFIVIDDVWETQTWETVKLALVENMRGSRIISTTRKLEVTGGEVYRLQPLTNNNSKKLFYTRIFGGEDKCPDNQVAEMSDKILKKCGGVPLAIITMASLLVGKSRREWSEVSNSTSFPDKDNGQVDRTNWILCLSYYDLPCHLRTCLLYVSAFPEDYTIDKNSLIWMWIAEDFVHKKPNIGLFEVGEGYFNDLVNRSMIQAVESESKGIINGCRVHDMVLDLLRSLSHEQNFVTILLDNDEGTINSARRLAHQKSTMDFHLDNHKGMQKLRSFIAYGYCDNKEILFQSFKLLRVLDLENVFMESWHNAKHIGNLLHLRYLGLKRTNMLELPEEIGSLKLLQTLDLLEESDSCIELPLSVGQLTQLVCLRARRSKIYYFRHPFFFSRLSSCINPSCLINLSHLELSVKAMDEQSMLALGGLPELRHLELSTESTVTVTSVATDGCFQKLRVCRLPSSAILFVLNKDSSVSFTILNGRDKNDIVLGSSRQRRCRRAPAGGGVMPNLQDLLFNVDRLSMVKCKGNFGNLGLEYLTSLKEVTVYIDCYGCFYELVMEAEAALRHAIDVHPNHPTLTLGLFNEESAFKIGAGD